MTSRGKIALAHDSSTTINIYCFSSHKISHNGTTKIKIVKKYTDLPTTINYNMKKFEQYWSYQSKS